MIYKIYKKLFGLYCQDKYYKHLLSSHQYMQMKHIIIISEYNLTLMIKHPTTSYY